MDFIKYILSRGLPKTGQVTEYVAGDDGTYEAGWWLKKLNINNRTRFITKTIGDDVIIFDRATGLCWAADCDEAGGNNDVQINWADAIAYANGLDFAGFKDWRIPNVNEVLTICNRNIINPCIDEPPFIHTGSDRYWTSTTNPNDTLNSFYVGFGYGNVAHELKTNVNRIRCVRKGL